MSTPDRERISYIILNNAITRIVEKMKLDPGGFCTDHDSWVLKSLEKALETSHKIRYGKVE